MAGLNMNFTNNVFDPSNKEQRKFWYELLKDIDDHIFAQAVIKIVSIERFAPNIAVIRQYCAEVGAPIQIEDTEGWGYVMKSIRNYGYTRPEEAIASLPPTVREAVRHMGGFRMICESEEPEVLRGQFNRAMAGINARERAARKTAQGLQNAMFQIGDTGAETKYIGLQHEASGEDETKEGIESIEEVLRKMGLRNAKTD